MKKQVLASLIAASCLSATSTVYAACFGNVYAMNAGRGHVGFMIDVQEDEKLTGVYNGSRAMNKSRALFSSSAMAYDKSTNRIYYVSTPRPEAYHVEGLESETTSEEFANLDFHASKVKANQLAYYDPDTNTHTVVADVPNVFRMAFDPATDTLYASDNLKVFTINTNDGSTTQVGNFDTKVVAGGFTNWGDFIFYNGQLLLVTNTRTFSVNTTNAATTLDSLHFIDFVTAATLDQNGQLLIATKNQNVTGNVNSTWLWRLNPDTGEKVAVGLFPNRISAMTTNTQEEYTCYNETVFPSETIVEVTGVTGDTVTEGENATFTVSFDKELKASKDVTLALKDGTAIAGTDYNTQVTVKYGDDSTTATLTSSGMVVTIPPGVSSISVIVPAIDDTDDEEAKTFSLDAWIKDDQSDKATGTVTINDNDEPKGACSDGVKLQMSAGGDGAWSYFGVDCGTSEVYFTAAGISRSTNTTLRWTTDYGTFSRSSNNGPIRGYVGITEIKTLQSLTVNGSSTIKPACQHGDVRGTPLSYGYSGSITINDDGTQQCYLRLDYSFCDGADNRISKTATSYDCDYTD